MLQFNKTSYYLAFCFFFSLFPTSNIITASSTTSHIRRRRQLISHKPITNKSLTQLRKNTSNNNQKSKGKGLFVIVIVIGAVFIAFIWIQQNNIPDDIPIGIQNDIQNDIPDNIPQDVKRLIPQKLLSHEVFKYFLLTDVGIVYRPFLKGLSMKSSDKGKTDLETFLEKAKKINEKECGICFNPTGLHTIYPCKNGIDSKESLHSLCLSDLYRIIKNPYPSRCPDCRRLYDKDFCDRIVYLCESKKLTKYLKKKHKIDFNLEVEL